MKIFLALFAGIISVFSFIPTGSALFIYLSLVIFIYLINNSRNLKTVSLAYGIAFFMSQLHWLFYSLYGVINTGIIIALVAFTLFNLYLASFIVLGVVVYNCIKTQSTLFNNALLLPSVWILFEWIRGWLFTGFPWCEIGYTQVDIALFKGFYPLIGNYGVSWLVISLCGLIYSLIKNQRILIIIAIFLLIGYYLTTITYTKRYGSPISIAAVQANISQQEKWQTKSYQQIYQDIITHIKADIIIIPETGIADFEQNLPIGYLDNLINIVKKNNSNLIVGIPKTINEKNQYVNAAELVTGNNREYYAKHHLVPYGEYIPMKWLFGQIYDLIKLPMDDFSAGPRQQTPIVVAGQKVAFNICYENGFASELTTNAQNATLMINLSDMIWYGNTIAKDEHLQISQARALENQRYFVQVTNTGQSAIISPEGVVEAQLPSFKTKILKSFVTGRTGITPFEIYGNYLIIAICIVFIGLCCLKKLITKKSILI